MFDAILGKEENNCGLERAHCGFLHYLILHILKLDDWYNTQTGVSSPYPGDTITYNNATCISSHLLVKSTYALLHFML